jgi:hypothetical protein
MVENATVNREDVIPPNKKTVQYLFDELNRLKKIIADLPLIDRHASLLSMSPQTSKKRSLSIMDTTTPHHITVSPPPTVTNKKRKKNHDDNNRLFLAPLTQQEYSDSEECVNQSAVTVSRKKGQRSRREEEAEEDGEQEPGEAWREESADGFRMCVTCGKKKKERMFIKSYRRQGGRQYDSKSQAYYMKSCSTCRK